MPDLVLIFEDPAIRVEACLIESETLVFSFNSYSGEGTDGVRAGHPFLPKSGFAAIYITARQSHWWQIADQHSFIEAIRPIAAPYARRIAYGSSMGGYGALLYAKDLDATGVVSVVPQTIISDPGYAMKREWADAIARVTITKDDIAETIGTVPDVRLLYDPWRAIDRAFIDYVAPFTPEAAHYVFPFVAHKVPNFLLEIGIISAVMSGILRGEMSPAQVRAASRPLRRDSPQYVANMRKRCARRRKIAMRAALAR